MPLRKFRSVDEMPNAAFRPPLDPDNLRLAFRLSATALRLAPRRFPAGVHKYRSVMEAWQRREAWERQEPSDAARSDPASAEPRARD
jgi:hypothetical protein